MVHLLSKQMPFVHSIFYKRTKRTKLQFKLIYCLENYYFILNSEKALPNEYIEICSKKYTNFKSKLK